MFRNNIPHINLKFVKTPPWHGFIQTYPERKQRYVYYLRRSFVNFLKIYFRSYFRKLWKDTWAQAQYKQTCWYSCLKAISSEKSALKRHKTGGLKLCVYSWGGGSVAHWCGGLCCLENSGIAGFPEYHQSRPDGLHDSKCHLEQWESTVKRKI